MIGLVLLSLLIVSICSKELKKIDLHRRALSDNSLPTSQNLNVTKPNSCLLYDNIVVQIDFEQTYNTGTNNISNSSKHIFLAVSLWSNETGFTDPSGSLFSQDFVCDIVDCTKEDTTFQFNSLWLDLNTTVSRLHLDRTVSIAGGAWQLKNSALSYDFQSLLRLATVSLYGWIGLGTELDAHNNFQTKNPIFSLLLPNNQSGTGSLIFGFDTSIADIDRPLMVISSDANWKMQMISLSFGSVVHFDVDQPLSLMFDLMTSGITIPKRILDKLYHHMSQYNITCTPRGCEALSIDNLPPLVFGFADGTSLSLSPNDYMIAYDAEFDASSYMAIALRAKEGFGSYEDHIIVGWGILSRFYTLFQQIDKVNTISFYEINSTRPHIPSIETSSDLSLMLIETGVILAIVVLSIGIVIFVIRKKRPSLETETTEMSKFEPSSISVDSQEHNHFL